MEDVAWTAKGLVAGGGRHSVRTCVTAPAHSTLPVSRVRVTVLYGKQS